MSEITPATIMWFRNDLRVSDNPALSATLSHKSVLPIYIYDDSAARDIGAAKRWWLHNSLKALQNKLREIGSDLYIFKGDQAEIINMLAHELDTKAVYWNRRYEPDTIQIDTHIKSSLKDKSIDVKSFASHLLHEPTKLVTKTGTPFRVFSPFWRALEAGLELNPSLPAPEKLPPRPEITKPVQDSVLENIEALELYSSKASWINKLDQNWEFGEDGAQNKLKTFLKHGLDGYKTNRDMPALEHGTSQLSPYMTFGEISPRQIWNATEHLETDVAPRDLKHFRSEVAWREFSYHLLFHNPNLANENYNPRFDRFDWESNDDILKKWHMGQTGYPMVDAGMRQLWQTGWMHNRVRMIAASFLTKHLMIDWRDGEKWFWDTLVDADPASNSASWQWVAGSGADAAPYFRIFNPIIQGKKFDPDGEYIKTFVPELKDLPTKYIHAPWEAPKAVLDNANIILDDTYPKPIVDHSMARERALAQYKQTQDDITSNTDKDVA